MDNIIKFDNSINKTNKRIQYIFNDEIKKAKKARNKSKSEDNPLLEDLDFLEGYTSNLLLKTNKRNWKIENTESKFIECYEKLKEDLVDEEEVWKSLFFMELIYFTDINPGLLDEEIDYIKQIVIAIDANLDDFDIRDHKTINRIISGFKHKLIKEIFEEKSIDDNFKMISIANDLIDEFDVFTIQTWYINDDMDDYRNEEDLQNGILTIDRVRDYYRNKEMEEYYVCKQLLDNDIDIEIEYDDLEHLNRLIQINNITLIKTFPEEYKLYYLDLVRKINSINDEDELKKVLRLTNLYIENGEQITEFDYEDLDYFVGIKGVVYENKRF